MHNCIFSAHCTEKTCDASCPILVETSYLLERNNISMSSDVFHASPKLIDQCNKLLESSKGQFAPWIVDDTVKMSELLTYCAICQNWKGSRLHCNVYNLKYSRFLEDTKKSWSLKAVPEDLEYRRIWIDSCKVLVISNIDFVSFGDFESQTLLNILQSRAGDDKTTIIVTPKPSLLVGKGLFFVRLQKLLEEANNK